MFGGNPNRLFTGSPISAQPFFNFGASGPALLGQLLAEPILGRMIGGQMMPGQFFPQQNLYDQYRTRAMVEAQQRAMAHAGEADMGNYRQMIIGAGRMIGQSVSPEMAQQGAEWLNRVSTVVGPMAPALIDAMHGSRGSSKLMAHGMFAGGRYAVDPVTGRYGLSAESAGFMANRTHELLYGRGADISAMKGIGAGAAGQLYQEMQIRGMGAPSSMREGGGDLANPETERRLREFDARRTAEKLKSMAGSISAMKDIFGSMGQKNAPMSVLLDSLEELTQGGQTSMSPEKIERTVRSMSAMARMTGMTMPAMNALTAAGGERARRAGLDSTFAMSATMHGAAFGHAFGSSVGGTPAWGRGSKEQLTAMDQQLTINAAASPAANQMAATIRAAQDFGLKDGTEAAALAAAIQTGQTEYEWGGRKKSVHLKQSEWMAVMQGGGIEGRTASMLRGQTAYNQKFIRDAGLEDQARRLQGQTDVKPFINQAYGRAFRALGGTLGKRAGELSAMAADLALTMDPKDVQNHEAMAAEMAKRLGLNAAEQKQLAAGLAAGFGNLEQRVRQHPALRGYGTADNLLQLQNVNNLNQAGSGMRDSVREGRLQGALAHLGRAGPIQRIMDMLHEGKGKLSAADAMKKVLGFVNLDEAHTALAGELEETMKLEEQARGGKDPASRMAAIRKLERMMPGFSRKVEELELNKQQQVSEIAGRGLEAILGGIGGAAPTSLPAMLRDAAAGAVTGAAGGSPAAADRTDRGGSLEDLLRQALAQGFKVVIDGLGEGMAVPRGRA